MGIKASKLREILVPLPPITEQHRIVERVDRLLPEIDKLKNDESKLDTLQKSFPKKMKDSILQYAIQGKLTEQLPEDGNAKDLLKDIKKEKLCLIKEGKIKKEKPISEISEEEIPFDIPGNWCWVKFGEFVQYKMGKTPSRHESLYWNSDLPWVSIADMFENAKISSTKENISRKAFEEVFKNQMSPTGTLIMSFKLTVGRVSILDIDAVHNEAIISIFPYLNDLIIKNYLFKILPTISQWGNTKDAIKGKTLNSSSLDNLIIPLPPLSEQNRIIERLEEILPFCETLE